MRLALVPVRLALVPVRLAVTLLGRLTGGRPWLLLILILGCGVIALHAATLQTNQAVGTRDLEINKLERETATMRNDVAELESTDRVSEFGRDAGMVVADPEGIGYVDARRADATRAAQMIAPPSADWKPAPNPSEQNGDAVDDTQGAAPGTDGTGTATGTAGAAAPASPSTAGATGTGASAGTGSTTGTGTPATATGGATQRSGAAGPATGTTTGGTPGTATGTGGASTGTSSAATGTSSGATGTSSGGAGTTSAASAGTGGTSSTGGVAAGGTTP